MAMILPTLVATIFIGSMTNRLEYGSPSQSDYIAARKGYVVGFNAKTHNPDWVAYRLTRDKVDNPKASRVNDFRADPEIPASAQLDDYRRSGYDRGHMAPAGSMKGSAQEMSESFLLTNMCPQNNRMNSGAWNRIEEWVRRHAVEESSLYVITGPIYDDESDARTIGANGVRVPDYFFKVVLDETPPKKMIAFIAANKDSKKRPWQFAVTVDEVEEATGFDFFSSMEKAEQNRLEAVFDLSAWR